VNGRWVIHLKKDENNKLVFKFGGQFYFSVKVIGWGISIVLMTLTGSFLF